jgi:hypothetical protein
MFPLVKMPNSSATKGRDGFFKTFKEPRNRFQGIDSASLCSPAGRYDNPIPTRFLASIDCSKIPAQVAACHREERKTRSGVDRAYAGSVLPVSTCELLKSYLLYDSNAQW